MGYLLYEMMELVSQGQQWTVKRTPYEVTFAFSYPETKQYPQPELIRSDVGHGWNVDTGSFRREWRWMLGGSIHG